MSDREDDQKIGINSSALFFGDYAADAVGLFFASTAGLLAVLGVFMELGLGFWIAIAFATVAWVWQYTRLRQPDLPRPVYGEIFSQNVWIGFVVLAGMIVGSVF
jgi:4-hydroxybenzoate polyprenyltransferase